MGNLEYAMGMFREYYLRSDIILPPRFTMREYGFMFFDRKYVLRHLGFKNKREIKKFFVSNVPRHAYYSTAYYTDPSNKDMESKGWLGADLIFDLDADHLPETEGLEYHRMLAVVKREAKKLIDDFLISDFGFSERDLTIVFSGGRGFHIYVRRGDVYPLKSDERREIVNYITGEGVNIENFLNVEYKTIRKKTQKLLRLYPPDTGGWYGKVSKAIFDNMNYLWTTYLNGGKKVLIEELNSLLKDKKLSSKVVKDFLKETSNYTVKLEGMMRAAQSKNPQILDMMDENVRDIYLKYLKEKIRIRGETDEPVSTDIHRLIRFIGSLHGKTGFIVRPLTYKEFNEFNPANHEDLLKFVVPDTFKKEETKIIPKSNDTLPFDITHVDKESCVPDYVAVFMVLRGLGDFISKC